MNILIVEDNPANLMLAAAVLRRSNHRITEARSAEEALECLRVATPELILMNVHLPGQDGLELASRLKAARRTRDVVIVALASRATEEDCARAIDAGCDGCIAKPIDTRSLTEELGAIVYAARAAAARARDGLADRGVGASPPAAHPSSTTTEGPGAAVAVGLAAGADPHTTEPFSLGDPVSVIGHDLGTAREEV